MAGVKQVNKNTKQIGKTIGRRYIAKLILSCDFPPFISDCFNDVLLFFIKIVVLNLLPDLPAPVSVQEKEAFYRRL
jgi:hypothetical protein